ncbi:FitA-like ribbon-helix-helix domain-containing protein [Candidatus Leptofilum sp.]|uniref:FitA-like ribbon-helix-helix domain-containing protein n=1 Tax=Candidatus Leptofilum sp. TaxID=3241576 RepID=UPI003B5C212B
MATMTIKNIPDALYEELKQRAAANRRSVNNEVIVLIERAVQYQVQDPNEVLERVRILREKLDIYVTEDEITAAKNEGRP